MIDMSIRFRLNDIKLVNLSYYPQKLPTNVVGSFFYDEYRTDQSR